MDRTGFGRMRQGARCAAAAALLALSATAARATTIEVDGGAQYTTDCTFACVVRYQQVYSSSIFSDPVTITSIKFKTPSGGSWAAGNQYRLSISTSANPVNGLSATFDDNLGADNAVFETRSFSGSVGAGAYFGFDGAFVYDPSLGDLLVDIERIAGSAGGPGVYYNSVSGGTFSRVYDFSSTVTGHPNANYGDVTLFEYGDVIAAPGPGGIAFLGLGALGFAVRRRRAGRPAI